MKKSVSVIYIYKSLIIFLITFISISTQAQWVYVGPQGFTESSSDYQSIAFNGSTPYVAFRDGANDEKATVMKFYNNTWSYVGDPGFSNETAGYFSLDFIEDIPYLAFSEVGINTIVTKVVKFNGVNWENVGNPGFPNTLSIFPVLKIKENIPYVSFTDGENGSKTTVKKYDGANWINVGDPGFSAGPSLYCSFAFGGDTPYVAFQDLLIEKKTTVMKFNGTSWVNVGIRGFSAGESDYQSIAVNGGIPFVAFLDHTVENKTTVMKFNGSDWVYVGDQGFSPGFTYYQCLVFDNNIPYVAFSSEENDRQITIMKFNGSGWENVGKGDFSFGEIYSNSLAFYNGTPYIAFMDYDWLHEYKTSVMKFEDMPLPVELNSFTSSAEQRSVTLNWTTATETNNSGFDIERAADNGQLTIDNWIMIGNVSGNGTSPISHSYSFTDRNLTSGKYRYRLKQIDYNGNFEYFNLSNEILIGVPEKFELSQNYPNPFNPTTNLEFGISDLGFVSLKVFNASGKEVAILVNEVKPAGYYSISFDGANLSSGIYFYTLEANNFSITRKMLLVK